MTNQPAARAAIGWPVQTGDMDAGWMRDDLVDHPTSNTAPPAIGTDQDGKEMQVVRLQVVMQQADDGDRIVNGGSQTEMRRRLVRRQGRQVGTGRRIEAQGAVLPVVLDQLPRDTFQMHCQRGKVDGVAHSYSIACRGVPGGRPGRPLVAGGDSAQYLGRLLQGGIGCFFAARDRSEIAGKFVG